MAWLGSACLLESWAKMLTSGVSAGCPLRPTLYGLDSSWRLGIMLIDEVIDRAQHLVEPASIVLEVVRQEADAGTERTRIQAGY